MEDYNIQEKNPSSYQTEEPARYLLGLIVGVTLGVLLGGLVAGLCCLIGSVYYWVVVLATAMIGIVVQKVSNRAGALTALISAVSGVIGVIAFTCILEYQGYVWEDGTSISEDLYLYMIVAALASGWLGWKDHSKDDE